MAYANGVDPDPRAVLSGSTLFAIPLSILRNNCINNLRQKKYGIKCSKFWTFTVVVFSLLFSSIYSETAYARQPMSSAGAIIKQKELDRAGDGTPSQIPTLLAEIALVPHSIV